MEKESIRKKIDKWSLRIIGIILLTLIIADISITLLFAGKIPHRFASAEEGKDLLMSNTAYYDNMTQNDIDYRSGKHSAAKEELMSASAEEIRNFNFAEKYLMDRCIAGMALKIKLKGQTLPLKEEIVYIKTGMKTEGGNAGYTHGTQIYLEPVNIMLSIFPGGYFEHLMWHELFHCLTRNDPDFRADMYSLINFRTADADFEFPPCIKDRYFSNPDVEHHDAYASFTVDGRKTDCFLVWICKRDYPDDGSSPGWDNEPVLVPTDGTDTYYTREQASDFDEVFGRNTYYVIDPEECMADNFADAMQYGIKGKNGEGYPDPQIIQGVIDSVSGK